MKTIGKERVTITLDPSLLSRVDEICERRREARSALIERILAYALDEYEERLDRLEGPLIQALMRALTKSPELYRMVGLAVGEHMTRDEAEKLRRNTVSDLDHVVDRRRQRKGLTTLVNRKGRGRVAEANED